LATKDDLLALATKDDLLALATKDELLTLATKDELLALATKEELRLAVAPLATKEEVRAEGERSRLHMTMLIEQQDSKIELLAEHVLAAMQKHQED
jgi:hypothetical protein